MTCDRCGNKGAARFYCGVCRMFGVNARRWRQSIRIKRDIASVPARKRMNPTTEKVKP